MCTEVPCIPEVILNYLREFYNYVFIYLLHIKHRDICTNVQSTVCDSLSVNTLIYTCIIVYSSHIEHTLILKVLIPYGSMFSCMK